MVGLPFDCLANPLGAVRLSFEKALSSGLDPSTSDGQDWGAVDLFRQFLFDNGGLSQVPILNATSVKYIQPNTLVRFRAMVQDMWGNELYVGAYKVPGLNSWAEPSETLANQHKAWTSQQREKRARDDDDEAVDPMEVREGGHSSSTSMQLDSANEGHSHSFSASPDSESNCFSCLVKVYDSPESDLKLNEVFEFIGVLNFDLELPMNKDEPCHLADGLEDDLVQLPPGKVPRIHCLVHRKLGVHDFIIGSPMREVPGFFLSLLDLIVYFAILQYVIDSVNQANKLGIRESLLNHLTALLGNDGVAAQFLLLHLLSRVHARVDDVAVGKFSLNLTCFSKETASVFGSCLTLAVKELLPFTQHIPLTIEYLNSAVLAPKKDYQQNRLVSGVLQLAEGSHLIIDETQLQVGTLNSTGVENVRSLKNLAELQKVEYDFQYYKVEMAADVQLLVLSEGKSNLLPADSVLPFQPSSAGSSEIVEEAAMQNWRWYLGALRSLSHSISPGMQKIVEEDLVAARQADRSLSSQDFSRLLTMGRLTSLSFGESWLTVEHWQMVKELERLRKERLR
ncbi:hypothetical protein Cgig2_003713 [Carnegiea gigantea]|uniref:Mini-chromosome maintenance complex-binding protein n=1 Tax=Carnegiea gigantea TaxID=171969 RepID=A0A9Q1KFP9_9CARY|nr:hypothetical protein Cgig2_003713 [Carnegiea gigantea]